MKFNNFNLIKEEPEFTEKDVKSESPWQTEEKVDYNDPVYKLGMQVNSSETVNTAFNFKFIPREKIQFNPNNDFEMNNIEELADSLLNIGMQHNLGIRREKIKSL